MEQINFNKLEYEARKYGYIYIYNICDPITGEIKYVGRTNNPLNRYKSHCNPFKKIPRIILMNEWTESLKSKNKRPLFKIVGRIKCCYNVTRFEILHIMDAIENGNRLFNTMSVDAILKELESKNRSIKIVDWTTKLIPHNGHTNYRSKSKIFI